LVEQIKQTFASLPDARSGNGVYQKYERYCQISNLFGNTSFNSWQKLMEFMMEGIRNPDTRNMRNPKLRIVGSETHSRYIQIFWKIFFSFIFLSYSLYLYR